SSACSPAGAESKRCAPCRANSSASAAPMPREAPVIHTTLPCRECLAMSVLQQGKAGQRVLVQRAAIQEVACLKHLRDEVIALLAVILQVGHQPAVEIEAQHHCCVRDRHRQEASDL